MKYILEESVGILKLFGPQVHSPGPGVAPDLNVLVFSLLTD